jgi:Kef-type K+ transport system membrane component KefB
VTTLGIASSPSAPNASVLPLLLALAILIASAKLLGELSVRLGQPAVLGELAAGLLLGPTFINILSLPAIQGGDPGPVIHLLGQLGVIWLMFSAGLETELSDLRQAGRPALLAGVLGVAVPLGMGFGVALAFGYPSLEAVALGFVLSATSVSISAQTLLELGRLRSREGVAMLGAAVIDDILVVLLLSVFVALAGGQASVGGIALQLGRTVFVLLVVTLLAFLLLPWLARWADRLRVSQGLLAMVLAGVLLLAWVSEYLGGVAAITGAFLAGAGLQRSYHREEIERGLSRLAYAFFVPLFLVDIGLKSNARVLGSSGLLFATVFVLTAAASKVIGSGLGGWLGGLDRRAALRMGVGMISRGEVGLIVAGVGVSEGLLSPNLFTNAVLMVLATTLITPPLLRWAFSR